LESFNLRFAISRNREENSTGDKLATSNCLFEDAKGQKIGVVQYKFLVSNLDGIVSIYMEPGHRLDRGPDAVSGTPVEHYCWFATIEQRSSYEKRGDLAGLIVGPDSGGQLQVERWSLGIELRFCRLPSTALFKPEARKSENASDAQAGKK